jgi:putative protease
MHVPARRGLPQVAALAHDLPGVKAALRAGADQVYLTILSLSNVRPGDKPVSKSKNVAIPVLPAICHDRDVELVMAHVHAGKPVVVNNLAELESCRQLGAQIEVGPSLVVSNKAGLDLLADWGVNRVWLCPELNNNDLRTLGHDSPVPLGLTVYGHQELMVSEHCVLMAQGPCSQQCRLCARRAAPRLLEDRKGYRFPVRTDDFGRSHIYNPIALDLVPEMPTLISYGISSFLVDGTLLNTRELTEEVTRAVRARNIAVKGSGNLPKQEGATTGHFFRGVL